MPLTMSNHLDNLETKRWEDNIKFLQASILCRLEALKSHDTAEALNLALTKDVLGIIGIVATLGRVNNDNLSRLLSEYLGLENMLAIVCRTYEAVQVLEKYGGDGTIISTAGIHGLGAAMGKSVKGRFVVICLEDLSPYVGGSVTGDPQRKLALPKPQLPNGECPHGFLGYAVNMINLDRKNSIWVTRGGHGLREPLFYSLLSRVQVYKIRDEMIHAFPCIHDGALSLDGGVIKGGVFILGTRNNIGIKFPATSGESSMSAKHIETEDMIRELKWKRSHVTEDMQREQELLDYFKAKFAGQV